MVKFGSLHVVRRISPLGAFYLAHFIDEEDAVKEFRHSSLRQRHLTRQANGELLVIYSGHSAHSLEWARVDLLASALRLEPLLGGDDVQQHVSPVLLVTACPAPVLTVPVSLPAPYTFKTRSSASTDEQQLISTNISPAYENELRVNFKTFQNALFLYSVADYGDHLIVQLAGGRVEVFFDFGGQQRSQLTGGLALNDGEWHELRWSHHFDTAELFIDGVCMNSTEIGGLYRKLDLHSTMEIGGRPEEIGDEQIVEFSLENVFYGCLAMMELNGLNLLGSAPKKLPLCQMPQPQLVAIGSRSVLQIPYSFLPFAFDFHVLLQRPQLQQQRVGAVSGRQHGAEADVALLSILDTANATLLQLSIAELDNGALSIRTSLGTGGQAPRVVTLGGSVARGWHAVVVKLRGGDALEVEMDGRAAYWVEGPAARHIGKTMHTFLLSATGCYRSATIDLKQGMPIGDEMIPDTCPLVESCSPNPCQNGGQCVQNGFASFSCECQHNYTGRFCHISKLPHSCEEHFASGAVSKRVLIDLDGGGPLQAFIVECRRKLRSKQDGAIEEVITIIRHDAPPQGIIVRGQSEPGAVRRILHYGLEEPVLDRLVAAFDHCGQLMRFQCVGGQRLMHYGAENRPSAWYATRNAQHGLQWGDAPPFSRMCSCALNDSCAGQRSCNCDSGQDAVDIGTNTHHQLLPILQLFIGGGTEPNAMANVSIGPLECSRRHVFETITFMDRNQRLIASHIFPSASTFHAALSIRLARPQLTVFTYASANHERWFQLFVRAGHLVGQLVYAGISHELVSDVVVDDDRWHTVSWEVDELSMRLVVDRAEKTVFAASVPPRTSVLIIGARTGKDRSGFAGQMRDFRLNGAEVALGQLAQRALGAGVQLGAWGACEVQNACHNDGRCVELYAAFTCNCSLTPFTGDTCEDEVGMWVPLGSELKIAWQHPAQMSNCYRISIQSASTGVALIRAQALFAESNFNMSIDRQGQLNVQIFDGVFFAQKVTLSPRFVVADNKSKDIRFCANSTGLEININGEQALMLEGNFTFFSALNSWKFVDPNFSGCIARLMVGDAFPLKDPRGSRLQHSGKIRFGSCPYDNLEHRKTQPSLTTTESREHDADLSDIHATSSNFMKSQRQLLFITPAIGFASALCILLSLCVFLLYIQHRPDGVYKTNERNAFVPIGVGTVGDNKRRHGNVNDYGNAGGSSRRCTRRSNPPNASTSADGPCITKSSTNFLGGASADQPPPPTSISQYMFDSGL
uniref:Neurexin-4 n=1 Tax=Globodera pallida TaxID=36090 RepID=A0A183BTN1_GLOPA